MSSALHNFAPRLTDPLVPSPPRPPPPLPPLQTPEVPNVLQAAEEPEQRGEEPGLAGGPPRQHLQRAAAAHEPAGRRALSHVTCTPALADLHRNVLPGKETKRRLFLLSVCIMGGGEGIPGAEAPL